MNKIIYIYSFVFLFACQSATKFEAPEDLIPKKQMVKLLTDMHLASSTYNINNKEARKNLNYMSLIYEKYGIDSIRFASSNLYYASNVNEYNDIFKSVQKNIDKLKKQYATEIDSIIASEQQLEDKNSGGSK